MSGEWPDRKGKLRDLATGKEVDPDLYAFRGPNECSGIQCYTRTYLTEDGFRITRFLGCDPGTRGLSPIIKVEKVV